MPFCLTTKDEKKIRNNLGRNMKYSDSHPIEKAACLACPIGFGSQNDHGITIL